MTVTETLRITSVRQYNGQRACFIGVPLASSTHVRSARYIVVVDAPADCLPMEPLVGQHWSVTGQRQTRQTVHGDFKITEQHFQQPDACEVTLPHDGEGLIRFLAKEPEFIGIGEVKARELWHTFNSSLFALLDGQDRDTLKAVLTDRAIDGLFAGYQKYRNLKHAHWFAKYRIAPQVQQWLFKFHSETAVETLQDNPYRLLAFGLDFEAVDKLAHNHFSLDRDDPRRLTAAVESALQDHTHRGGHTLASGIDIIPLVTKKLDNNAILANRAMQQGHSVLAFHYSSMTDDFHPTALYIMEKVVARRLLALRESPVHWEPGQQTLIDNAIEQASVPLTGQQQAAVKMTLDHAVSGLIGGAGTGKTATLNTVLSAYSRLGFEVKPMALSGKAAIRLQQSTGFEATTIARFLRDKPIPAGKPCVVVIDEASMVDLGLMYRIVTHTDPTTRLVLTGDIHQLPPIGAGLVLVDMVRSGIIPITELDIIQRQAVSSGIPEYSQQVRQGQVPPQLSTGHIVFHETDHDALIEVATRLYAESRTDSILIAATRKLTTELNESCQFTLNPEAPVLTFTEFGESYITHLKLNDPVLFTQNHYEAGVQNGTLGRLVSLASAEAPYGQVRLDDTGEVLVLDRALLDALEPAYCITLHKAQGSQFPRVIVCLNTSRLIDRTWLYTAITRAENKLHLVGNRQHIAKIIENSSRHHDRKTGLERYLVKGTG